ncbi:MAG: hypothetical protein Q9N34_08140 [Aquificota bacterium]|nr:hypothetical protein [Aquificota bacterium]
MRYHSRLRKIEERIGTAQKVYSLSDTEGIEELPDSQKVLFNRGELPGMVRRMRGDKRTEFRDVVRPRAGELKTLLRYIEEAQRRLGELREG